LGVGRRCALGRAVVVRHGREPARADHEQDLAPLPLADHVARVRPLEEFDQETGDVLTERGLDGVGLDLGGLAGHLGFLSRSGTTLRGTAWYRVVPVRVRLVPRGTGTCSLGTAWYRYVFAWYRWYRVPLVPRGTGTFLAFPQVRALTVGLGAWGGEKKE